MRRVCARAEEARALLAAVRPDTPDFVRLSVVGTTLEIGLSARSAASARATLEDLFACLKAAERTAVVAPPEPGGRRGERDARPP